MVESFRARSGSASGDYRRRTRSDSTSLAGLGRRGVPDADGAGAGPGDVAVVGAERHGDAARVALEGQLQPARLGVPQPQRLVVAAAEQALAGAAVGEVFRVERVRAVAELQLSRLRVPHLDRVVR